MMTENGQVHKPRGRRPGVSGEFFDDLEVRDKPVLTGPLAAPEPLKKVRVIHPFSVAHAGIAYWANEEPVVPESVADHWLTQKWCEDVR
jgi:hypothetical protein